MNSQDLANGMMFVDSIRMQQQQLQQMMDYEYFYRNRKKPSSYQIDKETGQPPIGPLFGNPKDRYKDIVEFPIESYDVLTGKTQAILTINDGFLVLISTPSFDWDIYQGRILEGLSQIKDPLITYVFSDNTIIPVLEQAGFQKTKMDKKRGKGLFRMYREGSQ